MKKMKKRILSIILSVLMVVSMLPSAVFAEVAVGGGGVNPDAFALEVESKEIAFNDESVTLNIEVKNNPGFAGAAFSIEFDDEVFSYAGFAQGEAATGLTVVGPEAVGMASPIGFAPFAINDVTGNGTLVSITFNVNRATVEAGEYDFVLSYGEGDISNSAGDELKPVVVNGVVTIAEPDPSEVFSFTVGSVETVYQSTVEIPVVVNNNPGLAGASFSIEFDDEVFTYAGYELGEAATGLTVIGPETVGMASPIGFASFALTDVDANGTFATVTFEVNPDTVEIGEYEFAITYNEGDVSNSDGVALKPFAVNGTVTILGEDFNSRIALSDDTVEYDGEMHTLALSGESYLPEGYKVVYTCDGEEFTGAKDAGTYNLTAVLSAPGYNKKTFEAVLTIEPKKLTYSGSVGSREYDGTTAVNFLTSEVKGIVEGDDVVCEVAAEMASANVGTKVAVNFEFIVSGDDADNYVAPAVPRLTGAITARTIKATANGSKKVGDTAEEAIEVEILEGELVEGDEFTGKPGRKAGEKAGVYATNKGTLALSSNYKLTFVPGVFEILDRQQQEIDAWIAVGGEEADSVEYGYDDIVELIVEPLGECIDGVYDNMTITSSNTDVAEYDAGLIVINTAGEATFTVSVPGDDDFAPYEAELTLTVTPKVITVNAKPVTIKVGADEPELEYTYEPELEDGDEFEGALEREAGNSVGEYDITLGTLTLGDNYEIDFVGAVFTIVDKTPQNFTAILERTTVEYGYADGEPIVIEYAIDECADGVEDTIEFYSTNEDVATVNEDGVITFLNAGNATVGVKAEGDEEYADVDISFDVTVLKRKITVEAVDEEKYIGEVDPPYFLYEITEGELVGDDDFTGELVRKTGEKVGKYDILQGTLALGDNYELTFVKGQLTILAKKNQVFDLEPVTEAVYGDIGFTYEFDLDGENVNADGTVTIVSSNEDVAYVDENGLVRIVGAGKTSITVTVSGNYMYNAWTDTSTLTVAKRNLTIVPVDASKRIGNDDPELEYELEGTLAYDDELVVTLTRKTGEKLGNYEINASYELTNSGNYNVKVEKGTFTIIDKYPQSNIEVTGEPIDITYGDDGFELEVVTTDGAELLGAVIASSSNPEVLDINPETLEVTVKNAGNATIFITVKGNEDYADYEYEHDFVVYKRSLTVKALAAEKFVGQEDPELLYELIDGEFVEGDGFTGELERAMGETVKTYEIKKGTLTAGNNYEIDFIKEYLTIKRKLDQNITFTAPSAAQYGDTGLEWSVEYGEGYNEDADVVVTSSNENVATVTEDGMVEIKGIGKTVLTAVAEANYMYEKWESKVTLNVTKRNVTINANSYVKKLGNDDPEFGYTLDGSIVEGDELVVTLTRKAGEKLGTYTISVSYELTNKANYNVTTKKGVLEIIDKYPQVITVAPVEELTYGVKTLTLDIKSSIEDVLEEGETAAFEYTVDNENVIKFVENDTFDVVGAGKAVITAFMAGNEDYADASVEIEVVVNPKTVNVEVVAESNEIYYGEDWAYEITYTGFVEGEDVSVLETAASINETKFNAGEYEITASGAAAANYTFVYGEPVALTVKPCVLAIDDIQFFNMKYKEAMGRDLVVLYAKEKVLHGVAGAYDFNIEAQTKEEIEEPGTYAVQFTVTSTGKNAANYVWENDGKYGFDEDVYFVEIKSNYTVIDLLEQLVTVIENNFMAGGQGAVEMPVVPEDYTVTVEPVYAADGETVIIDEAGNRLADAEGVFEIVYVVTDTEGNADSYTTEIEIAPLEKFNVSVVANNGTVTGEGEYSVLDTITLTATPDSGYKFSKWTLDGEKLSTNKSYSFNLLDLVAEGEDLVLTAEFTKKSTGGGGGGGGGGGSSVTYYYVTFNADDNKTGEKVKVASKAAVTKPQDPVKEGYVFGGWFTDAQCTNEYDFATKVTGSFELYAKWTAEETDDGKDDGKTDDGKTDDGKTDDGKTEVTEKWTNNFTDVNEENWFYSAVEYAVTNGLFNGVSETEFAPNATLTRAMLVTVLYRAEGTPEVKTEAGFTDVKADAYYAKAVAWGKENNIINGMSDTEFAPDNAITREQIASIMFRYAVYKGMTAVTLEENLHFDDAEKISPYAISAMNWAVGSGLMKGRTETTINPQDTATRAEAATILTRYFTEIAK